MEKENMMDMGDMESAYTVDLDNGARMDRASWVGSVGMWTGRNYRILTLPEILGLFRGNHEWIMRNHLVHDAITNFVGERKVEVFYLWIFGWVLRGCHKRPGWVVDWRRIGNILRAMLNKVAFELGMVRFLRKKKKHLCGFRFLVEAAFFLYEDLLRKEPMPFVNVENNITVQGQ